MSVSPPPVPNAAGAPPSAISDVSYRNYDGEMRTRALRWWIITATTIRANINRKKFGYLIPAILIMIIYLVRGIYFYATQSIRDRVAEMGGSMGVATNPYTDTLYGCLSGTGLLLAVAALIVGASVIAADNRANALLVYLSKPMTRADYLIGKWMGVFLMLAALTVIPSLILFLFFAIAYSDQHFLKENPTLILRLLGATLIPAAIHTSLIVGISAWSKTARVAGVIYAALYVVTNTLSLTMGLVLLAKDRNGTHPQTTAIGSHASVDGINYGIAMNLYQIPPPQVPKNTFSNRRRRGKFRRPADDTPQPPVEMIPTERPNMAIMLLLGGILTVVPVAAAYMKVRAVEVVRG